MNAHVPLSGAAARELPHNVEMEQAILGMILLNNDVMGVIAGIVAAADFTEEVHRRIFDVAQTLIAAGQTATPVTLKTFLGDHELAPGINLPLYLSRLRSESSSPLQARDYAIGLHDLAVRRKIIEAAEEVANQAYDLPVSVRPSQIAGDAVATLFNIASDFTMITT